MPAPPMQPMQFGFTKGLNQAVDERQIEPDALTVANNVVYQGGAFGKRYGFDVSSTGLSSATQILSYKNELLATDGYTIKTKYGGGWFAADKVSPCVAYGDPVPDTSSAPITNADLGFINYNGKPYHVVTFTQTVNRGSGSFSQVSLGVFDGNTGAQVFGNQFLSTQTGVNYYNPRVECINATAFIFAYRDDGNIVRWQVSFGSGSPSVGLEYVTYTNATISSKFATTSGTANGINYAYLVATKTGIPRTITVVAINEATLTATSYSTVAAANQVEAIGCCFAGGNINIAYAATNGANADIRFLQVSGITPSTVLTADAVVSSILLSNTIDKVAICSVGGGQSVICVNNNPTSSPNFAYLWWMVVTDSTGAIAGALQDFFNHRLISRPFTYNGNCYVQLEEANYRFNAASQYIAQIDYASAASSATVQLRPVAVMGARECNTQNIANGGTAVHVVGSGTGTQLKTLVEVGATPNSVNELWLTTLDFAYAANCQGAVLGDHIYMAGGIPSVYDGKRVSEIGFTTMPDPPDPTIVNKGTGSLVAGTWQYRIGWELVDARGYVVRSPLSPVITATIAGGDANANIQLKIPNIQLTNRQRYENGDFPQVYAVIYRTLNGQADVFYRLVKQNTPVAAGGSLINQPQTQYLTFVDSTTDTTLVSNAYGYAYTVGGELPDEMPSSLTSLVSFKNRLWGIGWDRRTVWFSKELVVGTMPGFHETLQFSLDDDGRPIIALASLDDYLVLFKERSIFVVSGDGPADSGQGSDLSIPRPVNTDVGCIDPRSIVRTPQGLMFLSRKGICLLTRGLEVQFHGYNVQKEVTTYSTCGGAAAVEQDNQVVWWMNNGTTTEAVVYDHLYDVWFTWTLANNSELVQSAVSHNGTHVALTGSGNVYTQNRNSHADNGFGFESKIETGWLKPAGLLGFCRIHSYYLLAMYNAASDLQSYLYYDYIPSVTETTRTWTNAQLAATTSTGNPIQLSVAPIRPECTAIKLGFSDTINTVPSGNSFTWLGVGVDFSPEPGLLRVLPALHR